MQELTKILLFFSTLLSTLSADDSFNWKKESTKQPFKGSQVHVHGRMMVVESDDSTPVPSRRTSRKMGQFNFFDPQQDIQHKSEKRSHAGRIGNFKLENSEVVSEVFEENEQIPLKISYSKQSVKNLEDNIPVQAQLAWQLPVKKKNGALKSEKKLNILPISSIHDLWFATKRILMPESQRNNRSTIAPASEFQKQSNSIMSEDDIISSRNLHLTGTQKPEVVDSQVYGPLAIETSTWSTSSSKPTSNVHYPKLDKSLSESSFQKKDFSFFIPEYHLQSSDEYKYLQTSTYFDKDHLKLTDERRAPNSTSIDAKNHLKSFESYTTPTTESYFQFPNPEENHKNYMIDLMSHQLKHTHRQNDSHNHKFNLDESKTAYRDESHQSNFRSYESKNSQDKDSHKPDFRSYQLKQTNENKGHQPNSTSINESKLVQTTSHPNSTKGDDMDAEESRGMAGWDNGGMSGGGGQPILLIKDSGDKGSDTKGWESGGMSKQDTLGPLIMMLTPLIMMCIMMPMMMSIMGGMMSFMKSVASMMMMLNMPATMNPMTGTLVNKHRKTGEEGEGMARGRVLLGSLILEAMDKLEAAISKYDSQN